MCVCSVGKLCLTLWPHGLQPARLLCPRDFPGKNTGVVCHFFLQGIVLTQGSNSSLLHCRQTLYCLSHQTGPLYTQYIMQNARLDDSQGGIKIAGRNINNLRYANDTTLMAESKEELKNILMRVKEESERAG